MAGGSCITEAACARATRLRDRATWRVYAGIGRDPQPGDGRTGLAAELASLRTFSDVYRNHLRAYLEALLRNVAEWERAEKSSLAAARADLPALDVP